MERDLEAERAAGVARAAEWRSHLLSVQQAATARQDEAVAAAEREYAQRQCAQEERWSRAVAELADARQQLGERERAAAQRSEEVFFVPLF